MPDNINIRVRLTAYSKGIIPSTSTFITDIQEQNDSNSYVRKNNQWVKLDDELGYRIEGDSGLIIIEDDINKIALNQWIGNESDLLSILEDNKTYLINENNKINKVIDGGNAFSDGNNDFQDIGYNKEISGGLVSTNSFSFNLLTLNSKGVAIYE